MVGRVEARLYPGEGAQDLYVDDLYVASIWGEVEVIGRDFRFVVKCLVKGEAVGYFQVDKVVWKEVI